MKKKYLKRYRRCECCSARLEKKYFSGPNKICWECRLKAGTQIMEEQREIKMKKTVALYVIFIAFMLFQGCKTQEFNLAGPKFDYGHHDDPVNDFNSSENNSISIQFDGCTLSEAVKMVSLEKDISVCVSNDLADLKVFGRFKEVDIKEVFEYLARSVTASYYYSNGVHWIIKSENQNVFALFRAPALTKDKLQSFTTFNKNIQIYNAGEVLIACGPQEDIKRLSFVLDNLEDYIVRSYVAEIFFIKITDNDLAKIAADFNIETIDIWSNAVNVDELFTVICSAEYNKGRRIIDQRPVLYLPEGKECSFHVGQNKTRETRTYNDETSISSTNGYQNFDDGTKIDIVARRANDTVVSLDISLEVSTFSDSKAENGVPDKTTSNLKLEGALLKENSVVFLGSLRRRSQEKGMSLLSFNRSKTDDNLTIWLRIKEVDLKEVPNNELAISFSGVPDKDKNE